MFLDIDV